MNTILADHRQLRLIIPGGFLLSKIIPAGILYKTHNSKFLTIIELKDYKHKIFVLMNYNKFRHFMNTKTPSSRQVQ